MRRSLFIGATAAVLGTAAPWCSAQDVLAGRNLAATCANCHGTNGQSKGEVPSLAGLPAERVVAAMGAFKSGALPSTIMQQISKGYTDEQVALIATYFALQKPARP